jgi:hypothetical protein
VELNDVRSSGGKRTNISNRGHTNDRTQTKAAKTNRKRDAQRHVSRESGVTKPLGESAPNRGIKPLSSREQDLRRNDTGQIGETGENSRTRESKCMVGRKELVAKTLKELLMGLGHTTQVPLPRKSRVTRHQGPRVGRPSLTRERPREEHPEERDSGTGEA